MSDTKVNEQCLLETLHTVGVTVKKGLPSDGLNQQTVVKKT